MSTLNPSLSAAPGFPPLFRGRTEGLGFRLSRDWGLIVVPAILMALRLASQPTSALAYVVAAMWALCGRRQAVLSLFFCWLFNNTSHIFCGPPLYGAILRYVVLFAAAFSVFVRGPNREARARVGILIWSSLGLFSLLMIHATVASRIVDISLLKTLSFSLCFLAALCGWAWMPPKERERCSTIIVGTLVLIMIASIAIFVSGRGYFRNTRLVQGFLVHSQILGVTAALTSSIFAVANLVSRPFRWYRVGAFVVSVVCMYLSGARAGMLAFVGGLVVSGGWEATKASMSGLRRNPRVVRSRLVWAAMGGALALVFAGGSLYRAAVQFVLKYDESDAVTVSKLEGTASERIAKVEDMRANMRRYPLEGIGFGVASDFQSFPFIARDPVLGLPIMATVEKGVMPIMVIEELGWPLGILTLAWVLLLGVFSSRGGLMPLSVYSTAMISNLGEATFFSAGGNGMLLILLVGWAASQPAGGFGRPATSAGGQFPAAGRDDHVPLSSSAW